MDNFTTITKTRKRKGLLLVVVAFVIWAGYVISSMDKPANTVLISSDLNSIIKLHQNNCPKRPFTDWSSAHDRHFLKIATENENE